MSTPVYAQCVAACGVFQFCAHHDITRVRFFNFHVFLAQTSLQMREFFVMTFFDIDDIGVAREYSVHDLIMLKHPLNGSEKILEA